MKDTSENTPEDPGETLPTAELRARYEDTARCCPVCNKQTQFLESDTVGYCTVCSVRLSGEKHDQKTPENQPEDTGETPAIMDLRTRFEGVVRFCPGCNMQTLFLVGATGSFCTACDESVRTLFHVGDTGSFCTASTSSEKHDKNPPEDPGEITPSTDLRARYEGAARFCPSCPSCKKQTRFLADETGGYCTTCGHFMVREEYDQMERTQSAEIREKILAVVDQKHGAFWGEFYDALIPAHSVEEVRLALNSLVQDGTLRMKEDDSEHDWEYRRVAASCVQPDPPTNQL